MQYVLMKSQTNSQRCIQIWYKTYENAMLYVYTALHVHKVVFRFLHNRDYCLFSQMKSHNIIPATSYMKTRLSVFISLFSLNQIYINTIAF